MATPTLVKPGRRGDIQGLRAVAVLLVVVYHTDAAMPGGYIGVDVFFVISGYVITRALFGEMESTSRINLRQFYLRRVRRILPALGFMLVVVMAASILLAPWGGQTITAQTGFAAALFSANLFLIRFGGKGYFDVDADLNALLHTWSLSVEEQFYMVFPALVFGAAVLGVRSRRLERRQAITVMLGLITGLSFALSWFLTVGDFGSGQVGDSIAELAFFSSVTRAWEFAAGGLLVFASARMSRLDWRVGTALSFAGLGLLGWGSFGLDDFTPFPGLAALIPVTGSMLLVIAGEAVGRNPVTALLASRPFQWLGDLSYSWYLWHWPVIVFAVALWPGTSGVGVIAAALSIVPAIAAYRFVETPIRFKKDSTTRSNLALAGVCILSPLIAGSVLIVGNQALSNTDVLSELDVATQLHVDVRNGCDSSTRIAQRTQPSCTWRAQASIGQAFLLGDSNAGHFAEGFTVAMNDARYDATVATNSGCPFIDLLVTGVGNQNDSCRSFVAQSIDDLVEIGPDLVVLASASDRFIEDPRVEIQDPVSSERARSGDEKQAMWASGLERTIDTLEAAGIAVAVVYPAPKFPDWAPGNCAAATWLVNDDLCNESRSFAAMEDFRRRAVAAESTAIAATNAAGLDVFSALCESDPCTTRAAGVLRWRDGGHISVLTSESLAPLFAALVPSDVV